MVSNVQDLFNQTGNGNVSAPYNYWYTYTMDFASVAAGATDAQANFLTHSDTYFCIDQINAVAYRVALDTAMLAYTPLMEVPSPTEQSNTMQALAGLSVAFKTNTYDWMKAKVRLPLIVGNGRQPFYPSMQPVLAPNETLYGSLANDLLDIVTVQIGFIGRRMRKVNK